jgi:4-amino-4-deoxy-L-arabinose transferase-like glycosyltransferase
MYIMILAGIPMGILTVFNPQAAATIATGMKSWLSAIPSDLWYVFGAGFSVYTVARSRWDKQRS